MLGGRSSNKLLLVRRKDLASWFMSVAGFATVVLQKGKVQVRICKNMKADMLGNGIVWTVSPFFSFNNATTSSSLPFSFLRQAILATVPIQSITFCTTDPDERRLFAFISRYKKNRSKCYVFFCIYNDVSTSPTRMAQKIFFEEYILPLSGIVISPPLIL